MANASNRDKTILVTGGAGFIGSHLCDRLVDEGNRVVCIDNFVTGNVRNIDALLQNSRFQFLRLDINEPFDLEEHDELVEFKIPFNGIDEIYHLACPTSIKKFDEFKIQTLLANSVGNHHVLEIAKKYQSKALLASSSVVYGDRDDNDPYFSEDHHGVVDHLTPRACYDEGKRFSETMFETYRQVHGLNTKIARIFRTYGPRMPLRDGHMIPDFIMNALEDEDLIVYGNEEFKTSLVYVTDIVDGLVRVMQAKDELGPVNIGSDHDVKITDVARQIIDMTHSGSKIVHKDPLPFLTELGLPRIERAKELGWLPLTRLEDGLRKTVEYMKANRVLLSELNS